MTLKLVLDTKDQYPFTQNFWIPGPDTSINFPIPGRVQGQVGQGFDQPDLVEGVPAHCRGVGLDDLEWSSLTQTIS